MLKIQFKRSEFSIDDKTFVGLIGQNNSGKTALFYTLLNEMHCLEYGSFVKIKVFNSFDNK